MTQQKTYQPLASVVSFALSGKEAHNLKRGISKHSEHYAYSSILPLLGEENAKHETLALRLAALIAEADIPQDNDTSLGKWLQANHKSKGEGSNPVEVRLTQMLNQNVEDAVISLSRILKLVGNNTNGGFNWYRLADTFTYWGDGLTDKSLSNRQTILKSYYLSESSSTKQESEIKE